MAPEARIDQDLARKNHALGESRSSLRAGRLCRLENRAGRKEAWLMHEVL
jgi:hypothetical protein